MPLKVEDKLRWTACVNLLYLGMLRKTRHWSFISWTLDVRSVPSHWEGMEGGRGQRSQRALKQPEVFSSKLHGPFLLRKVSRLPPCGCTHHHLDVLGEVFGTPAEEIGKRRLKRTKNFHKLLIRRLFLLHVYFSTCAEIWILLHHDCLISQFD